MWYSVLTENNWLIGSVNELFSFSNLITTWLISCSNLGCSHIWREYSYHKVYEDLFQILYMMYLIFIERYIDSLHQIWKKCKAWNAKLQEFNAHSGKKNIAPLEILVHQSLLSALESINLQKYLSILMRNFLPSLIHGWQSSSLADTNNYELIPKSVA